MKNPARILILTALLAAGALAGCTRHTVAVPSTETDLATVKGPVVFVSINGVAPDPKPKEHDVPAGATEVTILFRSYTGRYRCTYEFDAIAGSRYEFVTRPNPGPVTLYRVARENFLFGSRHDPLQPRDCAKLPKT